VRPTRLDRRRKTFVIRTGNAVGRAGVGHCEGTTWCPEGVTVSIFSRRPTTLPSADGALPGRDARTFPIAGRHLVLDAPVVTDQIPSGYEVALFGLGCFWGAEEIYWQVPGVWSTSVGYAGGITP